MGQRACQVCVVNLNDWIIQLCANQIVKYLILVELQQGLAHISLIYAQLRSPTPDKRNRYPEQERNPFHSSSFERILARLRIIATNPLGCVGGELMDVQTWDGPRRKLGLLAADGPGHYPRGAPSGPANGEADARARPGCEIPRLTSQVQRATQVAGLRRFRAIPWALPALVMAPHTGTLAKCLA